MIGAGWKKHYVFIKDFNTFMYDYTASWKKICCRYCLQAFRISKTLKYHIKDCVRINGKPRIKMPKKGEYARFKQHERKVKSLFMIYADLERILVPEDDRKQNSNESYATKNEKHVACSNGYKLVRVDDKLSWLFKSYLGEDAVYDFIINMVEESRYCSDVMQKHFNKKLVMTKEDNEDF